MKFTEDTLKLYDDHPLIIGNLALHHEVSFPEGTGYSQFLRNYSAVVLLSYFEDFMERESITYESMEENAEKKEWELLNEFRNTRNCIIHNSCQVDEKYLRNVKGSKRKVGDALMPSLDYLRSNSENLKVIARKMKHLQSVNREKSE